MARFLPVVEKRLNRMGWELGPAGSRYRGQWCALGKDGKIITDENHFFEFHSAFRTAEREASAAGEFKTKRSPKIRSDKPSADGLMPPKVI